MSKTIIQFGCPTAPEIGKTLHTLVKNVVEGVTAGKADCMEIMLVFEKDFKTNGAPKCSGCGKVMVEKARKIS